MTRFFPLAFTLLIITACGGEGGGVDDPNDNNASHADDQQPQKQPTDGDTDAPAKTDNTKHAVTLSVSASPNNGGSVAVEPPPPYVVGDTVTITASPSAGYQFDGWIGADAQDPSFTLKLSADTEISAQFSRIPANINVAAQPSAGATITVTPAGPHYVGDNVTVTVAVQPGYVIQDWSDGNGIDATRSFTLTSDVNVNVVLVAVSVASGPDTHTGNETSYSLSWTYIWDHVAPLNGYSVEESYNNGPFIVFDTVNTSSAAYTISIRVNRDPATHCYRVRARLGSFYSPYGNTHCMQRLAGPKRVMIINDIAAWSPSGVNLNTIVRVHAGVGNPLGNMNMLAAGNQIATGGGQQSFDLSGEPANYSVGFVAGYWDYVCNGGCGWQAHSTQVVGCDEHTPVLKAQVVNITNHNYDTVFVHTSAWLPVGNYGLCVNNQCARDPVCN